MIIVKGSSFRFEGLAKAEAILFVDDGDYRYVESGIVDNEVRVLKNWITADRPDCNGHPWLIIWSQGTEIPQELGDWLVAHQGLEDLEAKVLIVKQGDFEPGEWQPNLSKADPTEPFDVTMSDIKYAYNAGFVSGVFACGEILSGPLPNQDNN